MKKEALFCDGTEAYVSPPEPEAGDELQLWFRTAAHDVDEVYLENRELCIPMNKVISNKAFDFYEVKYKLEDKPFRYHFKIRSGNEICYYNKWGAESKLVDYYDFKIVPGFTAPDWAKGAVMYQIYTDRFCNGDPDNDVQTGEYFYIGEQVQHVDDWYRDPQPMDVREFYGGDIQGIIDKLDYLHGLGVEVVYCNPLFVSPSNHKYDTQDYDYIDPHVGKIEVDEGRLLDPGENNNIHADRYRTRTTRKENLEASNRLFIKLVEELHKRGMRIIIDGVFNHCGSFNKWLDRELIYESADGYEVGAFVSPKSPYRNYFLFHRTGENEWPGNGSYDGWWGHDTLPKLNYEDSKELEEYVLGIAKKWVSPPYNVDGWRLDVAADLGRSNEYNHEFWKKFRKAVKEANPHALILAEHYGDPSDWLQGDEWDSVMNYDAFMEPVTWFLTGMEKHSDEERADLRGNGYAFSHSVAHNMASYPNSSMQVAMNELSNHDHSRFLTRTNHVVGRIGAFRPEDAEQDVNPAVMREAVAIQMTWVGAPTVYYGDEAGVCGFTDPDSRRTYPWGHEDQEMIAFHRDMIAIHRKYPTLRIGSIKLLLAGDNVLAYARFDDQAQIVTVVNNSDELQQVCIPVWQAELPQKGSMRRLIYSYENGYTTEHEEYLIQDGEVVVNLGAYSVLVLKNMEY